MTDNDTPLEGPLSIEDILDMQADRDDTTPDAEQEEAQETEQEEVEAEADEVEEEADAEADEQDEPETEEEGPDVYDAAEYGEIAIALSDGTQTTLSDLVKGNLRQADYTRKTTEAAEARKELEAKEKEIAERERQLDHRLATMDEPEPDWAKLAEEDPLGLPLKQIQWQKKQQEKQQAQAEQQAQEQQQIQAFKRQTVQKALEAMPEWSDGKAFEDGASARLKAALDAGFTEEEYNTAIDYRLAVILEKAARYDAGKAKVSATTKKLSKVPKVIKPGASVSKSDKARAEQAAKAKRIKGAVSIDEYLDAKGVS